MKKVGMKRIIAYSLLLVLLCSVMPVFSVGSVQAATPHTRVVDASTMTDWQNYFGEKVLNTENAGGVWGDKSVFLSAEDFNNATEDGVKEYPITMDDETDNFLVALSAMASDQSIVGYSAIPTDTVFVLDVTGSMSDDSMKSLVEATNQAIAKLFALNPANNRVGVVAYSGVKSSETGSYGLTESAKVLLPVGQYEGETFLTYANNRIESVFATDDFTIPAKETTGDTYLQAGVQLALDSFAAMQSDVAVTEGPQAGTLRIPVMVLMSDGAPTAATNAINKVEDSTHGDGNASSSLTSYLTQLTCAYAKYQMNKIYGRSPLFYTTGLHVGAYANARAVLEPMNATAPYPSYWSKYLAAARAGKENLEQTANNVTFTVPVIQGITRDYVDRYYPVDTDADLTTAFDSIVNQINMQSKYYPTLVESGQHHLDGYITFNDELGLFMEVKDIKGLTVHNTLYPGSAIVRKIKEGVFGDIYTGNLGNMNSAGVAFLAAVEKRLGCSQTQAGEVISQALKTGQLSYTDENNFSNYIGWYADEEGYFLGFWNGKDHSARPSNAVYANKSYGFMGQVSTNEPAQETDMLHISVQVRTHIDWQHQSVIYKIPASLIPYVHYNIDYEGDSLEEGTNYRMEVQGAKEALRLVFEVGLREDINPMNVVSKIAEYEQQTGETYPHTENGVYHFYSNTWQEHTHQPGQLTDSHDATWLDFEPSYENERYYYTVNSPIYQKGDDYTLVTADPRGTGETYYTKVAVYSTKEVGLTEATVEYHYVPIKAETLQLAKEDENGGWYIPKGTVHRLLEDSTGQDYHNVKAGEDLSTPEKTHPTQSLDYSNYPSVVFPEDGSVHCDACLGNNGRLALTPDQGIALSKTMEVEGLGNGVSFPFAVTLTPPTGTTLASSYPVYDARGQFLKTVAVENGVMNLSLTPGETVYIVSLPTGTTYSVDEGAVEGWKILSRQNETGTVKQYAYNQVVFQNGPTTKGNLFLHKETVIDPSAGDVTYDKPFEFSVAFEGATSFDTVTVNGKEMAVTNGKLAETISVLSDETAVISGIPQGTAYTVTEVNLPKGWQSDKAEYTGTASDDVNAIANVVNTYTPEKLKEFNVYHKGVKTITGRDWLETDAFSFRFEYFNGVSWIAYSETQKVNGTMENKEFSFDKLLHDFVDNDTLHAYTFSKAGTYQFRIVEEFTEIAGLTYDYIPKRFQVEIANNFETGALEVAGVTTVTPNATSIEQTANGDTQITTTFNNRYHVSGTTWFTLNIHKELENKTDTKVGLDGFQFELYQLDEKGEKIGSKVLGPTDETGTIVYQKFLDADLVGQTLTYYLAEVQGDKEGMEYAKDPVTFRVKLVDNQDGSFSAVVVETDSSVVDVTFTNVYTEDQDTQQTPVTPPAGNNNQGNNNQENTPNLDDLPPKTGEDAPLVLWALFMMLVSGVVVFFLRKIAKQ